jgi:hypothetical protein
MAGWTGLEPVLRSVSFNDLGCVFTLGGNLVAPNSTSVLWSQRQAWESDQKELTADRFDRMPGGNVFT